MHGRILIVDASATRRIACRARLANAFYKPMLAESGAEGLRLAATGRPQMIMVALDLPDLSGAALIQMLREDGPSRDRPVIALIPEDCAPEDLPALRLSALRAGADAVLARPIADAELFARIRSLLRRDEGAEMMASAWGNQAPDWLSVPDRAVGLPPAPDALPQGMAEAASAFTLPPGRIALPHAPPHPLGIAYNDPPPLTAQTATRIALVARPGGRLQDWHTMLRGRLRDRLQPMTPASALSIPAQAGADVPEIFVIDADLGSDGDSGARLMAQLATHPACRHSAFCVVTAPGDARAIGMALDLGADDAVATDHSAEEIVLRLRAILRHKRRADRIRTTVEDGLRLAMIDPLTGCYNRRYALPRLHAISAQATESGGKFAVMVADLDRFKAVNDQLGHAAGDAVLAEVARRLSDNLRMADLLARIGGEEFLIALPQTALEEAGLVAERLRNVIGATPIRLPDGSSIAVTISIGVAVAAETRTEEISSLVERADLALRSSKTAGRNLVTLSSAAA